ncbi:hypothetical protein IJ531_02135 [bacterium]|nr:hypothetical protein [bacterium]
MRISPVSFVNFQKRYKKADVLRLVTGYDYKWSGNTPDIMKELTGVEYNSDEVKDMVDTPTCDLALYHGVQAQCRRKIFAKYPELKEADEAFLENLKTCAGDRAALDTWFKAQLAIMPSSYEIKPFKFSPRRLQQDNDRFMSALDKL